MDYELHYNPANRQGQVRVRAAPAPGYQPNGSYDLPGSTRGSIRYLSFGQAFQLEQAIVARIAQGDMPLGPTDDRWDP
jgi:hypothetical protein